MENKYEKIMEEEFMKDTNGFKSTSELCLFFVKHTLNLIYAATAVLARN